MRKLSSSFFAGALFGSRPRDLADGQPSEGDRFSGFLRSLGSEPGARMGGALVVTAITFRLILRRPHPLLDADFHLPQARDLDRS